MLRTRSARALLGGVLAASAARSGGYILVWPRLDLWASLPALLEADDRTGTGEQWRLTLADNVSIEMITRTSIALRPRTRDTDRIELIAGEGAFTVRAGFRGHCGAGRVKASNATFDIRRVGDTVRVPAPTERFGLPAATLRSHSARASSWIIQAPDWGRP